MTSAMEPVSEVWPENGERRNEWVCRVVEEEQGKSGESGERVLRLEYRMCRILIIGGRYLLSG